MPERYTWLAEWGSNLLSPWGYFQRFEFSNDIRYQDLLEELGVKWLPPHILASDKSDFVTFSALDDSKVRDLFGVSLREQTGLFIQRFFGENKSVAMYYPKRILQTCPICIAHGYHSQLHQIKGIDFCAFHDTPLQNCCPACGRTHWYRFSDVGFQRPFLCECGFGFMRKEWSVELWKSHQGWDIINGRVRAMGPMTQLYRISKVRRIDSVRLNDETMNMIVKTYKAFFRNKRRNKLHFQIHNIVKSFSAEAYAYTKTKMFAEHLDSYLEVDTGQRDLDKDLHRGLLSDTSTLMGLYRATIQHFPPEDFDGPEPMTSFRNITQSILVNGLTFILNKYFEHYLQEGHNLEVANTDDRVRAIRRREYKRTYGRKARDAKGNLI